MKFARIIDMILVLGAIAMMFTGCKVEDPSQEAESTIDPNLDEIMSKYKATAHLVVVDASGEVVFSTEEVDDEPYEYTSAFMEPTVINFLDDYAFIYDKQLAYSVEKNTGLLKSISVITKKGTTEYKAGDKYVDDNDVSHTTFWVCLINGKEIESMEDVIVKDGDVVEFRLTYSGQSI